MDEMKINAIFNTIGICSPEEMDSILEKYIGSCARERRFSILEKCKQWTMKKPTVNFSSATFEDCQNKDGLALDTSYIVNQPFKPSLYIPEEFPEPKPSEFLCTHLDKIQMCFVMDTEAACRMLIDAILLEILEQERERGANLNGFCEVKNDWESFGISYAGTCDYMISSKNQRTSDFMDSFLLVVEAIKDWPSLAVPQVLAEAGCLLRRRLSAGKKTPVFAVLTNGEIYRFFVIDVNGVVYSSDKMIVLKIDHHSGSYLDSVSLRQILRWLSWFIQAMKTVSRRVSQIEMTEDQTEDLLAELRCCFGYRQAPPPEASSSKRIKI